MTSLLLLLSCQVDSPAPDIQAGDTDEAIVRNCRDSFSYSPRQPGLEAYRPPPPPPPPEPGWTEKAGKAWDEFWKEEAIKPPEEAARPRAVGGAKRDTNPPPPVASARKESLSRKPASRELPAPAPAAAPPDAAFPLQGVTGTQTGSGGLGTSGIGPGGGGGSTGLGGLGTKGSGSGSSGYGSGGGSFGTLGSTRLSEQGEAIVPEAKPVVAAPIREGWGDEIHLSNDDSMSLASAQRLLWAAEKGATIHANEVRPHELLNYFHFDTQSPAEGQLFGVKGSAVADEKGKITLAFAVAGSVPTRRPLDLTLVLDRSGSMRDEGRMDYLKRGLLKMQEQLVAGDRVDIVLFDTEVCAPLENYVVGRDAPAMLTTAIGDLEPRGGTNVDIGLKEGYAIAGARAPSDRNRRMLLITDALLNTGDINPDTVTQIGKAYDESGIRLSGVGVGRQFNDGFLDKLTEKGRGPYVYLGSEAVVDRIFGASFVSLTQSLAEDVRFSIDLPDSLSMARFYGEEASTVEADIQPIHYQAGTTQLFLQDLKVRDTGISAADPLSFRIRWKEPGSTEEKSQIWTSTLGELLSAEPRSIYKARAIMAWSDMAMSRPLRTETCKNLWTIFQNRTATAGEDAELSYLSTLTHRLCTDDGGWTAAQENKPSTFGSRASSGGGLTIAVPKVTGKADPLTVRRVLQRHSNVFRYCHQRLLVRDPSVQGKLTVKFAIGVDGNVVTANINGDTVKHNELATCVVGRVLRMQFPAPADRSVSIVSVDFFFRQ